MLKNTFCHIPGVGAQTEKRFWAAGIQTWEDLLEDAPGSLRLAANRKRFLWDYIEQSISQLADNKADFFAGSLHPDQHWRLFSEFRRSTAYLDIETTGMGSPYDHITCLALYDGKSIFHFVHDQNLHEFAEELERHEVIVTYNGKCFDVPFIRNSLGVKIPQVHIDLRYVLKSLGYGGGLKGCEKQLGIARDALEGVDGFFAVLLWDEYRRNRNEKALETLLAYNILDTVNLETLMVIAYNLKLKSTPFSQTHALPLPSPPMVPFRPDEKTIHKIREKLAVFSYI